MASDLENKVVTGDALVSILTQSVTEMNNKLNNRPCISIDADTGHFIINEIDTGVKAIGEDGKSVSKIELDSNNNVTVTFTDGTSQAIGTLSINVQSTLLTNEGFGGIRYYNGKFQYIKDDGSWGDIVITNNNLLLGVTPGKMKKIRAKYDTELGKNIITMIPPNDTIVDNQTVCFVEKVIVRRKKDSVPESITDGEEVMTLWRKDFEKYQKAGYIDESCNVTEGDIWYYRAFPISTLGFVNTLEDTNVCDTSGTIVYGFIIDQDESDPDSMITYIEDNVDFIPVHMDYVTDKFDYGDWEDVWFIKDLKPCMLKYDGTVDYELDKNNYSKKADGSGDSDIANADYEGNAMIGIPKVYWKIVDNEDDTANVYFSNRKLDEDYHCWSHLDVNGNEIDYCYIGLFPSSKDSTNRIRSLAQGRTDNSLVNFFKYCRLNNLDDNIIWDMISYSDNTLLTLLLMLIARTTNAQTAFGTGYLSAYGAARGGNYGLLEKGLFYGIASGSSYVKVFGIFNWWGNCLRVCSGILKDNTTQTLKIKMTQSKKDGSNVSDYNTDGAGYLSYHSYSIKAGFIKKMKFTPYGLIWGENGGSATTYYCDALYDVYTSTSMIGCLVFGYSVFGYNSTIALRGGAFSGSEVSITNSSHCQTYLSCRPLATVQSNS